MSLKGERAMRNEILRIREEGMKAGKSEAVIEDDIIEAVGPEIGNLIKIHGEIKRGERPTTEITVPKQSEEGRKWDQNKENARSIKATSDFMEKVKKSVNEFVDIVNLILPIGWVIACYDGATKYLIADDLVRFFGRVFLGCIVAYFSLGMGMVMSGLETAEWRHDPRVNRWVALGIEIWGFLFITFQIIK